MKKNHVLPLIFAILLFINTGCVSQYTHKAFGEAFFVEHDSEDINLLVNKNTGWYEGDYYRRSIDNILEYIFTHDINWDELCVICKYAAKLIAAR